MQPIFDIYRGGIVSVGERIATLRKDKNISQVQIAQALNVSRQAVSKWENDQSTPDPLKMIQLADLLDTNIEFLSTGRQVVPMDPPVVIKSVEFVEKIVEKPIVEVVEKIIERPIEVPVVKYIEKPVIRKVVRTRYRRNPLELLIVATCSFLIGLLIGLFL